MLLSEGEFIGASVPQHLFLIRETCKQCQHPAHFTVLIIFNAGLGAEGPARKVPLCKNHWERAIKEVPTNPMKRPEFPLELAKLVPPQKSDSERAGCQ
jgi:hypothetical protein